MNFLDITVLTVWNKVWPILVAILFFGFIIFVHELGHFSIARLFKVKVNEFALGMGPTIFKIQGKETKYSLKALPIGGFCAMEGEDEESEDSNSFGSKKPYKRFCIIAAGAVFNLIAGLIIVSIMISGQKLIGTTEIAKFSDQAVSNQYGLQVGDKIEKINGLKLYTSSDISYAMLRGENTVYDFEVFREGKTVKLEGVQFATREVDGKQVVVYDFNIRGVPRSFANVLKNSFLEAASIARLVRLSLTDLATGKYGLKDLSGPVGTMEVIAQAATTAAEGNGMEMILMIMAFISINLGIFNLLPIPALDGGRLLFITLEAIRRKPLLPKYEKYVHAGGLMLLLAFMAVITIKDIVYLFK